MAYNVSVYATSCVYRLKLLEFTQLITDKFELYEALNSIFRFNFSWKGKEWVKFIDGNNIYGLTEIIYYIEYNYQIEYNILKICWLRYVFQIGFK